jgi:hypothetical protein
MRAARWTGTRGIPVGVHVCAARLCRALRVMRVHEDGVPRGFLELVREVSVYGVALHRFDSGMFCYPRSSVYGRRIGRTMRRSDYASASPAAFDKIKRV